MPVKKSAKARRASNSRRRSTRMPVKRKRFLAKSAWVLLAFGVFLAMVSGLVKGSELDQLISSNFIWLTGVFCILLAILLLTALKRKWLVPPVELQNSKRKTR